MYEVELKVRAGHDAVRERLVERGAERLGTVRQVDTYYDHPVRDFGETDEALRIRREHADDGSSNAVPPDDAPPADPSSGVGSSTATDVTYKGPLVEAASKTREEIETGVDDGEALASILDALGFDPVETVAKTRDRYRLEGYTVSLDVVADLGEFVEVETRAESVAPAREGAVALLEDLGLDVDEQIRTSYLGLLLEGDAAKASEEDGTRTDSERDRDA